MTRKLVTIRKVTDIQPIPNADSIECLTIEGWKVVSQKGNFKVGDPAVYIEVDSCLPDGNPLWQDLVDARARNADGKRVHVLKTIRLRGQISQGFCIPLRKFPEIIEKLDLRVQWTPQPELIGGLDREPELLMEDEVNFQITEQIKASLDFDAVREIDFAELLNVVKYEVPLPAELAGFAKGSFPNFITKTDQERCQNLTREIFSDLNAQYEVTLKLDGSSATYFTHNDEIGVCSRNLELKTTDENLSNVFVKMLFDSNLNIILPKIKTHFGYDVAIQGELMSPGIQGNKEKFTQKEVVSLV